MQFLNLFSGVYEITIITTLSSYNMLKKKSFTLYYICYEYHHMICGIDLMKIIREQNFLQMKANNQVTKDKTPPFLGKIFQVLSFLYVILI